MEGDDVRRIDWPATARTNETQVHDTIADCQGAACPTTNELGSGEIYFFMDATKANALRKWFGRRFKGRSKFARVIVPVQFCKDCGGAA